MDLLLHIGTEKTGTTSLQTWFAENRDHLAETSRIYYPRCFGHDTHRKLSIISRAGNDPDDGFWRNNIHCAEDHAKFREAVIDDFHAEYQKNQTYAWWVISNEHLHSAVITPEAVRRVRELLAPMFRRIQVIVHLRPQIDVAISRASTRARTLESVYATDFEGIEASSSYYNYDNLLNRWEVEFGTENVNVIPYKRNPNITKEILRLCGAAQCNLPLERDGNSYIDWRFIAITNLFAQALDSPDFALGRAIKSVIDATPAGERLSVGLERAQAFQCVFDSSNQKLVSRRPELEWTDLSPNWSEYDTPPSVEMLDEIPFCSDQIVKLISGFHVKNCLEASRALIAEAELADIRKNRDRARQLLQRASDRALEARRAIDQFSLHHERSRSENLQSRINARREKLGAFQNE